MLRRILDLDGRWDNDCMPWWQPLFWPAVMIIGMLIWRVCK